MARVRISTTVRDDLLARAREVHGGATDASVVEAALEALLREHRAADFDRRYAEAYQTHPEGRDDDWGDLEVFLDAAARS